ncbi:MAG: hypothetical protein RLZZ142_364 [Verrucomicrobiota bacterium]
MNTPHVCTRSVVLSRRTFLRGMGALVGLPLLESMSPVFSRASSPAVPGRMILISNNIGFIPKAFFPEASGTGYSMSSTLAELEPFRRDFTVFSGLSHPGVYGGHTTENCFLTAAKGPTKSGFRNQISLDQFAAETLGPRTRFPTLNLGVNIDKANRSLSFTQDGVLLPAEDSAPALFRQMFVQGSPEMVQRQIRRLEERGSILDALLQDAKRLERSVSALDRSRLDQYFTSIREVEERLEAGRRWELTAKPEASLPEPKDIQDKKCFFEKFELMLSLARLAIESDSTRIVTLMADAFATPAFSLREDGNTTEGYHGLSHHGQSPEKLRQLENADRHHIVLLRRLLEALAERREEGERLLDRTLVLMGSNMGDANTHNNTNLPILLAGGRFRHGQHLVFPHDDNAPLSNLFVSMLQSIGIEASQFGSSTGPLRGLERA